MSTQPDACATRLFTRPGQPNLSIWRFVKLPIAAGPMRGRWWSPGSRGKIGRVLLGSYEPAQTRRLVDALGAGDVFLDIGANAGYYTLLGASLVGPGGQVFAFEPEPTNAFYLRRHVRWNRLRNVTVTEAAIGGDDGAVSFSPGSGSGTGKVDADGEYEVSIYRLDTFFETVERLPTHLKIDVEGAEHDVLEGGAKLIRTARPTIFLSTHGQRLRRACRAWLTAADYNISSVDGGSSERSSEWICQPAEAMLRRAA